MVLHLASVLDVPLRDRNALLLAAGFAPVFRESGFDAPEMRQVSVALDRILRQQEPNPAVLMDRHWNILRTNEGAARLFGALIDLAAVPSPANVLLLMFDPDGLRPWVANWEAVAPALLERVRREAVCGVPDPELHRLRERLLAFPDVPARWAAPMPSTNLLPIVPVRFRKGGFDATFFSTVTTLGTPQDVTLQEIRIECFFPVDDDPAAERPLESADIRGVRRTGP